ncbi:MAG: hypothetical protein QGG74_00265 [Phycisphaerales bacterium]|jgi:hypothetical protein|nr:hypothetical protein [Phycisphaerales bacterium]
MSENLIVTWTRSLPPSARRQLASRILAHACAPASTVLAAFAEAVGLSPAEVSGLLPGGLVQARIAANQLLEAPAPMTRHPAGTSSPPADSF